MHTGHLLIAGEVLDRLFLDEIIFIPAGEPRFKEHLVITPVAQRYAMVELAVSGNSYFSVSDAEVRRFGASFTVDTLGELKNLCHGAELHFIMGWDNLENLPNWKEPDEILRLARVVAVPRVGFPRPDLRKLTAALPGIAERVTILNEPQIEVSASNIRERVKAGLSIDHLVPPAVERYIIENRLYRNVNAQKES